MCVGFSAHYDAMRREYGGHMTDGVAGENILVDFPKEVWLDDLGGTIVIEDQDTGLLATLEMVSFTAPCAEFSRFCLDRPNENVSKPELATALRFLGKGRRGFLLLLAESSGSVTVRRGRCGLRWSPYLGRDALGLVDRTFGDVRAIARPEPKEGIKLFSSVDLVEADESASGPRRSRCAIELRRI